MSSRCFSLLTKDVQPEYHHNLDYLISMLDWEANVNPEFAKTNKVFPKLVRPVAEMEDQGYRELWITYGTRYYSAKELTMPQRQFGKFGETAWWLNSRETDPLVILKHFGPANPDAEPLRKKVK